MATSLCADHAASAISLWSSEILAEEAGVGGAAGQIYLAAPLPASNKDWASNFAVSLHCAGGNLYGAPNIRIARGIFNFFFRRI